MMHEAMAELGYQQLQADHHILLNHLNDTPHTVKHMTEYKHRV